MVGARQPEVFAPELFSITQNDNEKKWGEDKKQKKSPASADRLELKPFRNRDFPYIMRDFYRSRWKGKMIQVEKQSILPLKWAVHTTNASRKPSSSKIIKIYYLCFVYLGFLRSLAYSRSRVHAQKVRPQHIQNQRTPGAAPYHPMRAWSNYRPALSHN